MRSQEELANSIAFMFEQQMRSDGGWWPTAAPTDRQHALTATGAVRPCGRCGTDTRAATRTRKSVRRRHPWIFSGRVADVARRPAARRHRRRRATDGEALGRGAYSPASQIRARMWTFDPDTVVDDAFVADRIARRCSAARPPAQRSPTRRGWCSARPTACPGVIADRYGDTIVVQLTTAGADRWRESLPTH